ncbi:hypothetical protein EKH55_5644 (plasmid) [Sinorhizobium alkalisoli]|nr:hypothetical protein EKH55_5644 [Sinorhizobium alkalisoli]
MMPQMPAKGRPKAPAGMSMLLAVSQPRSTEILCRITPTHSSPIFDETMNRANECIQRYRTDHDHDRIISEVVRYYRT